MLLGDRVVLAHYATEAFQAQAASMSWWCAVYYTLLNIALIARIIIGRLNGEGIPEKMGAVIWQMLWFSLALFPPMIALSIWVVPHLIAPHLRSLGVPYLRILFIAMPIAVATFGAITSFFSGRGKTRYTLIIAATANVVNLLLCISLVYGIGPFPAMGIIGAALGMVGAQIFGLFLALCFLFFPKEHRTVYHVFSCRFEPKLFWAMWCIGLPSALSCLLNWSLWSWMYQMAAIHVSRAQFTAFLIGHTIFSGMSFLIDGVGQGVGVICANAYGAKDWDLLRRNRHSWIKLLFIECLCAFEVLVLYPQPLIAILMPADTPIAMVFLARKMLFLLWILLFIAGIATSLRSTLIAFGDTKFILYGNLVLYASCSIFPSYLALRYAHNILLAVASWIFYNCLFATACYIRSRILIARYQGVSV
jgi:MATE family multidrug resistance protein